MPRELYFTTLDFLMKAIEAKEAEIVAADAHVSRARLEAQMAQLHRRLQVEFCYLAAVVDGGHQTL